MGSEPHELCVILAELNFGGQQTLVSPNSFDKPNIVLVCKILDWFSNILKLSFHQLSKPNEGITAKHNAATLTYPINSLRAADYVEFLCEVGRLCFQLIGVRLNLEALCKADQSCCPELLKIGRCIFEAAQLSVKPSSEEPLEPELLRSRASCEELLAQVSQEGNIQKLSLECCQLSEELQALLRDEETRHLERLKLIDRRLELEDIKRVLGDSLDGIERETEQMRRSNVELERDCSSLDEKLAAKEAEISATRQKLGDLLSKSPAYASQYEALMREYESAYERYVSSYRNYAYLRSCTEFYWDKQNPKLVADDLLACLGPDSENSYRNWIRRHGTGVRCSRWWDFVNERPVSPSAAAAAAAAQLEGLSKKSSEEALFVFDSGPVATRLAEGRDTVGPARLLESLLLVSGTSKPRSESLLGTPGARGGAGVVLAAAETTTAGGRARDDDAKDRRLVDAGLELEGLLDEFAPVKLAAGVSDDLAGGATPDEDEGDDSEDEEEEDDDEEDEEEAEEDGDGLRGRG